MYIVYHIPIQCKSASTCWCMLQRFGCVFFQDSVLPFCSHCEFRLISKTDSILNTSFGRIPPLQPSANCWIVNLEPSCINKWMAGRMDWWCICPCLFQLLAPKSCMYIITWSFLLCTILGLCLKVQSFWPSRLPTPRTDPKKKNDPSIFGNWSIAMFCQKITSHHLHTISQSQQLTTGSKPHFEVTTQHVSQIGKGL